MWWSNSSFQAGGEGCNQQIASKIDLRKRKGEEGVLNTCGGDI